MLSVRLDDKEAAQLRALEQKTGLSRSSIVKRALEEFAARRLPNKSAAELAEELGIIGCFAGPGDLSENVGKYFRRRQRAKAAR